MVYHKILCNLLSIQYSATYIICICSVVMCSNFRPCSLLCVLLSSADTPSSCGDSLLPRQSLLRCLQPSVLDACLLCTSRPGSDATSTRKMKHHLMPHHSHPLQFFLQINANPCLMHTTLIYIGTVYA